jgi:hypothetical protein
LNSRILNTAVYLCAIKTGSRKPPKLNFHLLLKCFRDFDEHIRESMVAESEVCTHRG